LLIDALNDGSIDAFASRLSPEVTVISEDTRNVIASRTDAVNYFNARLDGLNRCDPDSYLAVAGTYDAGDGVAHPCAIIYDRFRKSCVLRLGVNRQRLVEEILLSAVASTLDRARPMEPPAFPQTPILPTLTIGG
jgi:hypothetical protein